MAKEKRGNAKGSKHRRDDRASPPEDLSRVRAMLRKLGLEVQEVLPDGNCLFRSFAVQLKGVETFHDEFRQNCCDWLRDHQEMFQDFVDLTEEGFDDYGEYVTNMRQSTTWGGQVELTALCGAYDVAALVIRAEGVNYEIKAKEVDPEVTRCILLAYHDGEHYNSVVWEDGRQHTLAEARERFDSSVSPIAEPESEPKISRKKLKKKLQKDKRKNKERSAQKANGDERHPSEGPHLVEV